MLSKKYKSELINISNPIEGIYTLDFKSLNGSYKYNPGQFLHLAIDSSYDSASQWPDSRCFSIQSNLDDETIKITYAVKGQFTRQMEQQLHIGSVVWLKLPYGDLFTKPHNKVNTIFIAGGTGITPFLSLFTHKSFSSYNNPKIYLGFRSEGYNIYKEDLDRICNSSQIVQYFYENIDGRIDIDYIININNKNCDFFISGPPAMISSFKKYLIIVGIPERQVITDNWE